MWPILSVILMAVILKMEIYVAGAFIVCIYAFVSKFSASELILFFRSSLQPKLYINTLAVMILKEFIMASNAIHALPDFFAQFPIPTFLIFTLIFFFGSIISGSQAIISLCLPVAMASVPGPGLPLFCLLMGITYVGMQMSPTHVCLTLIADYFGISFGNLIKKTLPAVLTTVVFTVIYYILWTNLLY